MTRGPAALSALFPLGRGKPLTPKPLPAPGTVEDMPPHVLETRTRTWTRPEDGWPDIEFRSYGQKPPPVLAVAQLQVRVEIRNGGAPVVTRVSVRGRWREEGRKRPRGLNPWSGLVPLGFGSVGQRSLTRAPDWAMTLADQFAAEVADSAAPAPSASSAPSPA